MTVLTAKGAFAESYMGQFGAEVVSIRETDKGLFLQKLSDANTIIHNAATINSPSADSYIENNFDFSRLIIKHLEAENRNAHLILLSSMSILNQENDSLYGDVLRMTPYAYSKYLSETYSLRSTLDRVSCIRFSTLFYMNPERDGLSKLIHDAVINRKVTIYNGGIARRNFIPIDLAAGYVEKISSLDSTERKTYNICAPSSTSYRDVVDILKKHITDLQVENKVVKELPAILSEFSTKDIDHLGRTSFELEDFITGYIERLS